MNIITIKNQPVSSNCYIIIEEQHCLVIDPGSSDCKELLSYLTEHLLSLDYIILTHEHYDHISGADCLRMNYPQAMLICSEVCNQLIQSPKGNLSQYSDDDGIGFSIASCDISYSEDSFFSWMGHQFNILLSPGHSKGSICLLTHNILFSGDTLIPFNKTVLKLPGGSKFELYQSLCKLQTIVTPHSIVYLGHLETCLFKDIISDAFISYKW